MDTVVGPVGSDSAIPALHFVSFHFMLAFKLAAKTSECVKAVFDGLKRDLGPELFKALFPVILTDRGCEFADPRAIEADPETGERLTRVFFCDSYCSYQKGSIEENHTMVRYVFPNGTDFGRHAQEQISLAMSHINSYARKSLQGRTPYQLFEAFYGKATLERLKIGEITPDSVNPTPKLLD